MKVVFTEAARDDLDEILAYIAANYPSLVGPFEKRIQAVVTRLTTWPESAPSVAQRPGVRVASLVRYPYRIFYRVEDDAVEIVHIRHTSRRPWEDEQ